MKRGHLCAVRYGKRIVERVPGMTPARFDILYAIRRVNITSKNGDAMREIGIRQDELCEMLGLHRSTVSVSLIQLEDWQWIRRERSTKDGRTKMVFLTALGLSLIARAMKIVFRQRALLAFYEEVLPSLRGEHVVSRIGVMVRRLHHIAEYLGDGATLQYDFGWPTVDRWPSCKPPPVTIQSPGS